VKGHQQSGIYGDRIFAFRSSASPKGFPLFNGPGATKTSAILPALSFIVFADTPGLIVDVEALGGPLGFRQASGEAHVAPEGFGSEQPPKKAALQKREMSLQSALG
jgi:hypothetical protein